MLLLTFSSTGKILTNTNPQQRSCEIKNKEVWPSKIRRSCYNTRKKLHQELQLYCLLVIWTVVKAEPTSSNSGTCTQKHECISHLWMYSELWIWITLVTKIFLWHVQKPSCKMGKLWWYGLGWYLGKILAIWI